MARSQTEIVNKSLHPQARELVMEKVNEFATQLLLRTKTIASQRKADIALSTHVEEAHDAIFDEGKRSRARELKIAVGGALFGAFIQGFINELSLTNLRPLWISVYTVVGFIGIFLVFWGLSQD